MNELFNDSNYGTECILHVDSKNGFYFQLREPANLNLRINIDLHSSNIKMPANRAKSCYMP